ncbi:MAG: hypothetical protein PHI34_06640 [Acidobacteriota bacterium]|nr:hypothetical protein [Acidobacteriota bacterium]
MPPIERRYRILGRTVSLSCDRAGLLRLCDRNFGFFRQAAGPPPRGTGGGLRIEARLRASPPRLGISSPAAGGAALRRAVVLPSIDPGFVFNLVQREIFRALPGFAFLHAAVAVKDGGALVVAGPSGAGKTTLLLALIKAGFAVYSDEYGPVNLKTGRVHAFPRELAVRTKRGGPAVRKTRASAAAVVPAKSPAVPIRQMVFLETVPAAGGPSGYNVLIKTEATDLLLKDLGSAGCRVTRIEGTVYDSVTLPPAGDCARVIRALNARREAVLNIHERSGRRGAFAASPDIREIPASEAAGCFLAGLIDSSNPWTIEKPGAAFFRVCGLLKDAVCLSVRSGTPGGTAKALAAIWKTGGRKKRKGRMIR